MRQNLSTRNTQRFVNVTYNDIIVNKDWHYVDVKLKQIQTDITYA